MPELVFQQAESFCYKETQKHCFIEVSVLIIIKKQLSRLDHNENL